MRISMILAFLLFFSSCENVDTSDGCNEKNTDGETDSETTADSAGKTLDDLYMAAIRDAVFADSDEIAHDLISITTDDDRVTWMNDGDEARVLVVTWTSYPDSYPPGETVTNVWGDLWVTVSPELKERISGLNETSSLRIAQLLGMPANATNSHFATLWVRPSDMFRPAPDNEITDHTCTLLLPDDADAWYADWYAQNTLSSYFPPAYPWTRLGYTYDWAPGADEQGLSEFVIKQGASFIVKSIETTEAYGI